MRVLIIKLTSLGDVIHSLPAVNDAFENLPDLELDWLVEESFHAIPHWHPAIRNIYTAATRRWRKQPRRFIAEFSQLKKQLKQQNYDLVIDAQGLLKSAYFTRSVATRSAGYDKSCAKEPLASLFYQDKIKVDAKAHAIVRIRQLFSQALGYEYAQEVCYGINKHDFIKSDAEKKYLVFLHGTTWESKLWPVVYWRQLLKLAQRNGYNVMLLWGNNVEQARADEIAQGYDNAQVCAKMDFNQIAGLLSGAQAAVAVDTGLAHLAAALSVPCVSLYGATDSARTGTIGAQQIHLQAAFQCSPCLNKKCNFQGSGAVSPACFEQITPQRVWQTLQKDLTSEWSFTQDV